MCCIRPKILQLNGMNLSDFATHKEALKTADDIIAENKSIFDHDVAPIAHDNPLLIKYWYVHSEGKRRSHAQIEAKTFSGGADVKNKKQMVGAFIEGFGDSAAITNEVKAEFPLHNTMKKSIESVRFFMFVFHIYITCSYTYLSIQRDDAQNQQNTHKVAHQDADAISPTDAAAEVEGSSSSVERSGFEAEA
jgi:hypothetical protein